MLVIHPDFLSSTTFIGRETTLIKILVRAVYFYSDLNRSGRELKLFDIKSQDVLSYSDYFFVKPKPGSL